MFYELYHPISDDYYVLKEDADFSFSAHLHYCYELVIVTDGRMDVRVDEKDYHLGAGDALMIFPNQVHSMMTDRHSNDLICIFSPGLINAYTTKVAGRIPSDNLFRPSAFYIEKMLGHTKKADKLHIKGLLYSIAAEFDEHAKYTEAGKFGTDMLANSIFRFIEENYTENCSLSALSQKTGYDYAYLSAYFKKTVGLSYNEYVNRYRISKACYLLTNSDRTVLDISSECGFNSLRSMNRNFRKQTGMTPAEYRRQDGA